jgi:hypothetical protein
MPGRVLDELERLWRARQCGDEFLGTLVNAYIAAGGSAAGVRAGLSYVDVGTIDGYRRASALLALYPDAPPNASVSGRPRLAPAEVHR